MNTRMLMGCLAGALLMLTTGCKTCGKEGKNALPGADDLRVDEAVRFNSDSAYAYAGQQVAFGPRVPGTPGSRACADYIIDNLQRFRADTVTVQTGEVKAFNGDVLPITNIMASFNPGAPRRILLAAHYDTRPWADSDPVEENRHEPIPGANDGASGAAVLLEIARQLGLNSPEVGVDLLFVDAEDYGQSSGFSNHDQTWCLGTQYWTEHLPYASDSLPEFGIVLDMVGGMGAKFHREYISNQYASDVVDKVWAVADKSGYGDRFINVAGGSVVDDHLYLNKAGIPSIDIIESKSEETKSFPANWHTTQDDMDHIDTTTLKAVGQTVLNVIYNEKG